MATNISSKRKSQQRQAAFRLLMLAAILICVNMLASRFHYGFDLTKEKRFTLSDATKKMLRNMKDVAVVEVYLKDAKLPSDFQRLADVTRERLLQFKEYAGNNIVFRFVNPLDGKTDQEKLATAKQLLDKGIMGLNIRMGGQDDYSEKIVFPWAQVTYKGRISVVSLVENPRNIAKGLQPEDLNYAETLLEYKLATAIHKSEMPDKPRVAYIMGNEESLGPQTYDALSELGRIYNLDTFDITASPFIPSIYNTVIINKPRIPFGDKEKFKIDQYVMNGGHILWMLDMLNTPMDSLATTQQFVTMPYDLNLDDLLFRYGVRVNNDLVEDWQSLEIPVARDNSMGDKTQYELKKWIYFPVFSPNSAHPIVKNMAPVMGRFANSIDTIQNTNTRKTVLLQSSKYSRLSPSPVRVSLSILKYDMRPDMFTKGNNNVAVLIEGKFSSIFKNRLPPDFLTVLRDSIKRPYKEIADADNGKMIVVSDADIMENDFSATRGMMEMGYWRYTGNFYANKNFLLNCMEYLTDSSSLLEARSKDARLRLLDPERVRTGSTMWRTINVLVPLILVLIFASCYLFFRKRKYEVNS